MRKAWCAVAAVLALSAGAPAAQAGARLGAVDTREAGPAVRDGKLLPVEVRAQTLAPVVQRAASARRGAGREAGARDGEDLALPRQHSLRPLLQAVHAAGARGQHRGLGGQRPLLPRRRLPQRLRDGHGRAGAVPRGPVRHGHVPARVGRLQRPAGAGRERADAEPDPGTRTAGRSPPRRATGAARATTS